MSFGWVCCKLNLPSLLGMLFTGILLGPYVFNLIDISILNISSEIRKMALVVILTRAGFGLEISSLKKIGRAGLLMCFVPATFELIAFIIFGPILLGLSIIELAIIASILAAVSPAVVVPRMVKLIDKGYGKKNGVPQVILAGASVDDVYVIVLFTTFIGMIRGESLSIISFINIPISIILGMGLGFVCGKILSIYFEKIKIRDTKKAVVLLSVSFILITIESWLNTQITFSALISIMFIGIAIKESKKDLAEKLSIKYNKLWVIAEIILFVLVGATVNINYLVDKKIIFILIIICIALTFRMFGVFVSLLKSRLNKSEKIFAMLAYTPKATVQATIGAIPLRLGLTCGDIALNVAVVSIVFTALLGAFAIDLGYKKLLSKDL